MAFIIGVNVLEVEGQAPPTVVGTDNSRSVAVVKRRLSHAAAARAMCPSPRWAKTATSTS